MTGDTILIKDISINGKTLTKTKLSETLTDNTINALGIDASSRTIWINGQPYGNAYVNIKGDVIVPCRYDAVSWLNEGLLIVVTNNKCTFYTC